MHVGGLQLFRLPDGAGPDHVSELYRDLLRFDDPRPLMRRRPVDRVGALGQLFWTEDAVDMEYHVRLTALPRPGRVRELLELTSRLHGALLDRHRPLWEFHLIEGLEQSRFAAYAKIHHALMDGVSAARLLAASLSEDPDAVVPPPWQADSREQGPGPAPRSSLIGPGDLVKLGRTSAGIIGDVLRGRTAPRTMFNVPITGSRRFAAQSWPVDRLKSAGSAAGATLNDVVLAMCAGALRRYLLAENALPARSLIAAVPVSLRVSDDSTGGNAIGSVLCDLATNEPDPHRRLVAISASMSRAKGTLAGQSRTQIQFLTGLVLGIPAVMGNVPGAVNVTRPVFNLVISNIPGPTRPLYWNGALLEGAYPVSVPYEGQALNITVASYAGNMHFGIIGCRRRVPHLQRLLTYLDESLAELER
jgi:diacylglycerol O-acyltransferase / wax synthase